MSDIISPASPITLEGVTHGRSIRKVMNCLAEIVAESFDRHKGPVQYYVVTAPVVELAPIADFGDGPRITRTRFTLRRDDRHYDDELLEDDQHIGPVFTLGSVVASVLSGVVLGLVVGFGIGANIANPGAIAHAIPIALATVGRVS